jgi:hypothetical protein
MKAIIICIAILVSISFSCQHHAGEGRNSQTTSFDDFEQISLELDLESSYDNRYYEYHQIDGNYLLFFVNPKLNQIKVYDLVNGQISHTINVPIDDPDGFNQITSFTIKSKDSLFVFSGLTLGKVFLTNWKGESFKELYLKDKPGGGSTLFFNHLSISATPSKVVGDKIYFFQFPLKLRGEFSHSEFEMNLVYDLKNDSIYTFDSPFPKIFKDKSPKEALFCFRDINSNGDLIYSFFGSDSIYIQKPDMSLQAVYAGTKLISVSPNFNYGDPESSHKLPKYGPIIYNPYRNEYYRFYYHGSKFNPNETFTKQQALTTDGIIYLDKNFQIISSFDFQKKYAARNYFVSPKGLYRSVNNEYANSEMDEDFLVFEKVNLN